MLVSWSTTMQPTGGDANETMFLNLAADRDLPGATWEINAPNGQIPNFDPTVITDVNQQQDTHMISPSMQFENCQKKINFNFLIFCQQIVTVITDVNLQQGMRMRLASLQFENCEKDHLQLSPFRPANRHCNYWRESTPSCAHYFRFTALRIAKKSPSTFSFPINRSSLQLLMWINNKMHPRFPHRCNWRIAQKDHLTFSFPFDRSSLQLLKWITNKIRTWFPLQCNLRIANAIWELLDHLQPSPFRLADLHWNCWCESESKYAHDIHFNTIWFNPPPKKQRKRIQPAESDKQRERTQFRCNGALMLLGIQDTW